MIRPLQVVLDEHMLKALHFYSWNISQTAIALGMHRRTLYRSITKNKWMVRVPLRRELLIYESNKGV